MKAEDKRVKRLKRKQDAAAGIDPEAKADAIDVTSDVTDSTDSD